MWAVIQKSEESTRWLIKSAFPILVRGTGVLCLMILLSSCAVVDWFAGDIKDYEVDDLEKDMRAYGRKTIFDESLHRLGDMLLAYGVPDTPIQSKNIGSQTAAKEVPSDLYVMVATAINKINRPLIFIPFDVQYVIGESTTGGIIERILPKIVITGGITGFDKEMIEKSREGDASGGWAGAQGGARYSADDKVSRVSVDLSMMDYRSQSYFPGVNTSNSILLHSDGLTWGIYGYYMGNGASFDYELRKKQGVDGALRNLVEFSIIELIGKHFKVPYWKVIPGANPDTQMINLVYEGFKDFSEPEKISALKKLLFLHGYPGIDIESDELGAGDQRAVESAMEKTRSKTIAQLYLTLWLDIPLESAKTRALVRRRMQRRAQRRIAVEQQQQRAAEAERQAAIQAQQREERNRKVNEYNSLVVTADKFHSNGELQSALEHYLVARRLFPDQAYPTEQINRINAALQQQKRAVDSFRQRLAEADRKYATATSEAYNAAAFRKLKEAYLSLAREQPDNQDIGNKLRHIDQIMSKYRINMDLNGGW